MTLRVVGLAEIRAAAAPDVVLAAVRDSLIAHAEGASLVPPPAHLLFAAGDCHVKTGYLVGAPHFAVKVATGFPGNQAIGLPANNGLILVLDAATGIPAAVLADEGWLTAWRTAAAGALITHALAPAEVSEVAVLGTGLQARLQVEWLTILRPLTLVKVWGRHAAAVRRLCADLQDAGIAACPAGIDEAAGTACVITATAATAPLAPAAAFGSAGHVTAIGADMPGKNELPPALFARAAVIATDDHAQCLDHGDFGNAVRTGHVAPDADIPVGVILRDGMHARTGPSIADLTGVGAADAGVAAAVLARLGG